MVSGMCPPTISTAMRMTACHSGLHALATVPMCGFQSSAASDLSLAVYICECGNVRTSHHHPRHVRRLQPEARPVAAGLIGIHGTIVDLMHLGAHVLPQEHTPGAHAGTAEPPRNPQVAAPGRHAWGERDAVVVDGRGR